MFNYYCFSVKLRFQSDLDGIFFVGNLKRVSTSTNWQERLENCFVMYIYKDKF